MTLARATPHTLSPPRTPPEPRVRPASREDVTVVERRNGPETRQAIVDRFSELVADRGFEEASVSAVAGVVGVSKGTVVHHFPAKDLILQEAHLQYIERRIREMNRVIERESDPRRQLSAMMYCIIRAHRDDRAGTVSFLREFSRFVSSQNTAHLRALRSEFTSIMSTILRKGDASGVFTIPDITLTTLQVFGMCNYVWTWYRPEEQASAEKIAAVFARNILLGFMTGSDPDPSVSVDSLLGFFEGLGDLLEPVYPAAPPTTNRN
ncbi:hypothetical protein CH306_26680 [Rhodococcus sp. 15-725-2-2b]|uniref:TetR family transcriptional regulator n=1 Tax=unclassified Rhodococcus (in: high G+C Gram-positive bacteria) TaxID=192944 RepID=UPI000B9C13BB|nr:MULTISPECIES: TetR family transcriptional regulator [unclassified Rhodococcus (in: high G+C Gram-positive bacteria)]OZC63538.1 hypothetical protein CH277_21980 [Rhodococcus sp. 06-469-3-2]OZD40703.1 hypothetical protein CH264_23665 [Rhodococcus sp. 06-1477-1A]OZE67189.1 hypothetical protein CH306_26680 [Rhodococcus sp. 15-725-2-2b]